MQLDGKTIVVTGVGRGLGQKMAQDIAAHSANLALVDINAEALEQTLALCQKAGAKGAKTYAVDVSDESQVERLLDDVVRDFGGVDGLVNNAGVTRDALLVKASEGKVVGKMSFEDWDQVMRVDLRGIFLCAREAAARMIEGDRAGVIVNISSISRAGNMGQTNYAAAKAGVAAMTTTWAQELARHGIRVAAIAPGFCDTKMVASMKPKMVEAIKARVPLKRLGDPAEISQTALFLFHNDYINGRVIEVDGGLRL